MVNIYQSDGEDICIVLRCTTLAALFHLGDENTLYSPDALEGELLSRKQLELYVEKPR